MSRWLRVAEENIKDSNIDKNSKQYNDILSKALEDSDIAYNLLANEKITKEDGDIFYKVLNKAIEDYDIAYNLLKDKIITKEDGDIFYKVLNKVTENRHDTLRLLKDNKITQEDLAALNKSIEKYYVITMSVKDLIENGVPVQIDEVTQDYCTYGYPSDDNDLPYGKHSIYTVDKQRIAEPDDEKGLDDPIDIGTDVFKCINIYEPFNIHLFVPRDWDKVINVYTSSDIKSIKQKYPSINMNVVAEDYEVPYDGYALHQYIGEDPESDFAAIIESNDSRSSHWSDPRKFSKNVPPLELTQYLHSNNKDKFLKQNGFEDMELEGFDYEDLF